MVEAKRRIGARLRIRLCYEPARGEGSRVAYRARLIDQEYEKPLTFEARVLTGGLRRSSIVGGIILQKLIHGLKGLIISINDLQVLNRR